MDWFQNQLGFYKLVKKMQISGVFGMLRPHCDQLLLQNGVAVVVVVVVIKSLHTMCKVWFIR